MWSCFGDHSTSGRASETTSNFKPLRRALFSGSIQYHGILPWFSSTAEKNSEKIMDMDWGAEWDDLSNESWVPETNLAGSTQKVMQDFRKW